MRSSIRLFAYFGVVISLAALGNANSKLWGEIGGEDVFLRRERVSANAIIRNTTEMFYKYPRLWDDNEFPLTAVKVIDKLPPNITEATIVDGGVVNAKTKTWGTVGHTDVYLRRESIYVPSSQGADAAFNFVFPKPTEVNKFVLRSIRAYDNDLDNKSSVKLVNGGVGTTEVKLSVKSPKGRGIDFAIEIYGQSLQ